MQTCEYEKCPEPGDHRIIVTRHNIELNVHVCEGHAAMLRNGLPIALNFYTWLPSSTDVNNGT